MPSGTPRLLWTLALVTLAIVGGIPIVHDHAAEEPGVYDPGCSLAELATRVAGAPLPSRAELPEAPLVAAVHGEIVPVAPTALAPLPFDSRAPPPTA